MTDTQPRKLEDFGELRPAEQKLLSELDTGELVEIGEDVPVAYSGGHRVIRARFLRWVILGCEGSNAHRVHEKGIQVQGALITGEGRYRAAPATLDLQGTKVEYDIVLKNCRLDKMPEMAGAQFRNLCLDGCHVPGLRADGLSTQGSVLLRRVVSHGEIRLLGATIHGNLECDGAILRNASHRVLNADGARITDGFFWRQNASAIGTIDLSAAEIGVVNDDPNCWPDEGKLRLNRCRYGAFTGKGISAKDRLDWLSRLWHPKDDFRPQPYEQCAKVLREMGHQDDAREVLIEKEKLLREARRKRAGKWMARAMGVRDWLLSWTVCYGQKPLRTVWILLAFWLVSSSVFWAIWHVGAFKPNGQDVLLNDAWVNCSELAPCWHYHGEAGEAQLKCFLEAPEGKTFPEFNPVVYSFDVLLPIVQLEQQMHWVPDEDQWQGWLGKALVYVQIVMGWLLSLLAVAGLSGIIKSD